MFKEKFRKFFFFSFRTQFCVLWLKFEQRVIAQETDLSIRKRKLKEMKSSIKKLLEMDRNNIVIYCAFAQALHRLESYQVQKLFNFQTFLKKIAPSVAWSQPMTFFPTWKQKTINKWILGSTILENSWINHVNLTFTSIPQGLILYPVYLFSVHVSCHRLSLNLSKVIFLNFLCQNLLHSIWLFIF